jgi:hypothetical protein
MWGAGFGRGFGPVVRQTAKWMDACSVCYYNRCDLPAWSIGQWNFSLVIETR